MISEYEKSLFARGVLNVKDMGPRVESFLKNSFREPSIDAISFEAHRSWVNHYDGKVPAHWLLWYEATRDLEEAGKKDVQLSQGLIDAAVNHPVPHVPLAASKYQRLDEIQAGVVLSRSLVGGRDTFSVVIGEQQNKGVDEDILKRAQVLGLQIMTGIFIKQEDRETLLQRFSWPILNYLVVRGSLRGLI